MSALGETAAALGDRLRVEAALALSAELTPEMRRLLNDALADFAALSAAGLLSGEINEREMRHVRAQLEGLGAVAAMAAASAIEAALGRVARTLGEFAGGFARVAFGLGGT